MLRLLRNVDDGPGTPYNVRVLHVPTGIAAWAEHASQLEAREQATRNLSLLRCDASASLPSSAVTSTDVTTAGAAGAGGIHACSDTEARATLREDMSVALMAFDDLDEDLLDGLTALIFRDHVDPIAAERDELRRRVEELEAERG